MYYLTLAALTWLAAIWVIDWKRWRELLIYGLWGALVAQVENELGESLGLWEYRDVGPIRSHDAISLLIALSAAPLFAMAFAQALKPGRPFPWLRSAFTTALAMLPEIVALYTRNIVHRGWWSTPVSVIAYLPTWFTIWLLHRWMTRPKPG